MSLLNDVEKHLFQFQFYVFIDMSSSFILRIVFGLFVLCVFHSVDVKAQKFKSGIKSSRGRGPAHLPLTAGTSKLLTHSSQTSLSNSMTNVNLHSLSSSSSSSLPLQRSPALLPLTTLTVSSFQHTDSVHSLSKTSNVPVDIHRSASVPSLNVASSPSIMREITHAEAASVLNTMGFQRVSPPNPIPITQRMIPNLNNIRSYIGKYWQPGAIAAAGTGGIVQIAETINGNECCEEKTELNIGDNISKEKHVSDEKFSTITTKSSEIYNPIGTDK